MIQLYIKKQLVSLSEDFKFTFLFENPYFTKCSNSTLDIYIPLEGCRENLQVFGPLNRYDVTKKKLSFEARLMDKGRVLLNGTAIVNQVTDKGLKIQLVSGNSEMNFRGNDDKYIDTLDLGIIPIPEDKYPWGTFHDQTHMSGPDVVKGIFTPVMVGDKIYNRLVISSKGQGYGYQGGIRKSAQPYLMVVLEAVAEAMGYHVVRNDLRDTPFNNLYICSAYQGNEIKKTLPHWTVCEFLDEIEKIFSVVTVVDEKNKSVSYINKVDYYSEEEYQYIDDDELLRSYEAKISSSGSQKDISVGNVGYDLPRLAMNNYYQLEYGVLEDARKKNYPGNGPMYQEWEGMSTEEKNLYVFVDTWENRSYINYTTKVKDILLEVDTMSPIRRKDTHNIDVKLKIVPACLKYVDLGMYGQPVANTGPSEDWKQSELWFLIPEITGAVKKQSGNVPNYQDFLANGGVAYEEPTKDIMEVAFNLGHHANVKVGQREASIPVIYTDNKQQFLYENICLPRSGSLTLHDQLNSIGARMRDANPVNSDVAYHFRFLYNENFDVKKKFLIGNQMYVCEKIEVEVDVNGFSKVAEGIFYKL